MKLAEGRATREEIARLKSIERDLGLVNGKTYTVRYKSDGIEKTLVGRFVRIGRSHDGTLREGLRFAIPGATHTHIIDRVCIIDIDEVEA